jgi:hypothetical protein
VQCCAQRAIDRAGLFFIRWFGDRCLRKSVIELEEDPYSMPVSDLTNRDGRHSSSHPGRRPSSRCCRQAEHIRNPIRLARLVLEGEHLMPAVMVRNCSPPNDMFCDSSIFASN